MIFPNILNNQSRHFLPECCYHCCVSKCISFYLYFLFCLSLYMSVCLGDFIQSQYHICSESHTCDSTTGVFSGTETQLYYSDRYTDSVWTHDKQHLLKIALSHLLSELKTTCFLLACLFSLILFFWFLWPTHRHVTCFIGFGFLNFLVTRFSLCTFVYCDVFCCLLYIHDSMDVRVCPVVWPHPVSQYRTALHSVPSCSACSGSGTVLYVHLCWCRDGRDCLSTSVFVYKCLC